MRWLNARLIVGLAPLLSLCDAVDGAPAGALVAGAHRRAPVENSDSPWHRRYAGSRRQVDINVDVNVDIPNVDIPVVPAASGKHYFFTLIYFLLFLACSSLGTPVGPSVYPAQTSSDMRSEQQFLALKIALRVSQAARNERPLVLFRSPTPNAESGCPSCLIE